MTSRLIFIFAIVTLMGAATPCGAAGFEEDVEAVEGLREVGIDLSKPVWLEFVFHFEDAEGAQKMWDALAGDDFRGQIRPADSGGGYMVYARKQMLVEPAVLARMRDRFERLARDSGGSYEGWGVP